MKLYIDYDGIEALFAKAEKEGRNYLYEYEVYELIRLIGGETPLKNYLQEKGTRIHEERLNAIPGNKVVIKVVSPEILHKSDVGGVRVVDKKAVHQVLSAIRSMTYEVPDLFSMKIEKDRQSAPPVYRDLSGDNLVREISNDIKGFLICEYLSLDSSDFGNELLVSLRNTREFGLILSAGLGGTDTELFAEHFKKGQAVVSASTGMTTGDEFFEIYQKTLSYKKLAGKTRGQKRMVTDEQLLECFSALAAIGVHYSPLQTRSRYVIEELEVNPFAFSNYLMAPLDGICRFSVRGDFPPARPVEKINNLLHPESIGIIGVSAKVDNIGRIILKNILANGYNPSHMVLIHPAAKVIDGVKTICSLSELDQKLDLLILAVSSDFVADALDDLLENDYAESVILIPGGFGEKAGNEEKNRIISEKIKKAHLTEGKGPVFLGGNSLGILSHPGKYDSLFIPEDKLPKKRGNYSRHSAFISQSGAYMITRMSKMSFIDPSYALSIGNQMDLTASDILNYLNSADDIRTIASYMEGFNDFDGYAFAEAVKDAVLKNKDVIFYKAGRTPEGKSASAGHTASLAGDYDVCKSCMTQAGAVVAKTFTEFEGLFKLAATLHDKEITGNRLAAISNAGYESVGIADNILGEDFQLEMAGFSEKTCEKIASLLKNGRLDSLVDVKNPMDVTPMAAEEMYEGIIEAMLEDENIDVVIVAVIPLSPSMETLSDGSDATFFDSENNLARRIPKLAATYKKPVVMVVDSGSLFDPLANKLQSEGLPVFRSADQAVWFLGKYIHGRLNADKIRQNRN